MSYQILILRRAQKELAKLFGRDFERVKQSILKLSDHPRPSGCRKLTGRDGWRIRVGKYRVIYEIDEKEEVVIILHIGHRKDIYKHGTGHLW